MFDVLQYSCLQIRLSGKETGNEYNDSTLQIFLMIDLVNKFDYEYVSLHDLCRW